MGVAAVNDDHSFFVFMLRVFLYPLCNYSPADISILCPNRWFTKIIVQKDNIVFLFGKAFDTFPGSHDVGDVSNIYWFQPFFEFYYPAVHIIKDKNSDAFLRHLVSISQSFYESRRSKAASMVPNFHITLLDIGDS